MPKEAFDHTTRLPEETITEVFSYLDEKSQSNLALTKKLFGYSVFQQDRIKTKLFQYIAADNLKMAIKLLRIRPELRPLMDLYLASKQVALFNLAGFAEQNKMKNILESYSELFYTYAPLKDISNVYPIINKEDCKGITVFQHAVWAGDVRYMCNMMLDCLSKNEAGEKIRIELLRQYKELMKHGVVYEIDGTPHYEKQFSLQSLLNGLSQYVTNYESWTRREREFHWCKGVGLLQKFLTAHFRHHYCNPEESFWNAPSFTMEKLVRSLNFYNYGKDEKQIWDASLVDLGSDFGITGGPTGEARAGRWACDLTARHDLRSLTTLCEVRTKTDLPALIERLNSPIQSPEKKRTHLCVIS